MVLAPPTGRLQVIEAEDMVKDQIRIIDEPEQHFFIANADGSTLKLRESFDYGHGGRDGYYARYSYADKVTKVLTQTKVAALREGDTLTFANLFYVRGGEGRAVRLLRPVGEDAWAVTGPDDMFLLTAGDRHAPSMVAKRTERSGPLPRRQDLPPVTAPNTPVLWQTELSSPVAAIASGEHSIVCGTKDGEVVLLNRQGKRMWRKDTGSRVRTVALATFAGGRQAWLVGTHAGHAKALDARTGRELWTYACLPYHGRTGSVATIFPADLDGDGAHEVVAGSDNHHYHGLSAQGKLLWRTNTVHASTVGCAGDLDGNGRDDVAAGTEYYWPRLLGHDGKQIGRSSGGPVTSAAAVFDADGNGKSEAFLGMEDCFVRCIKSRRVAWKANVGGAPTAIEPLDVDGDGKAEIICGSESFSVYALRADGKPAWRTQLSESVNDLAVVGDRVVAGCDDGRVYVLSRSGRVVGSAVVSSPITAVERVNGGVAAVAAGRQVVAVGVD